MIECKPAQFGRTQVIVSGTGAEILRDTAAVISAVAGDMVERQLPKNAITELISAAVASGVAMALDEKKESAK